VADDYTPPPAPRPDDVLFGPDDEFSRANAWLGSLSRTDLPYLEGYRRGARTLAEHVCKNLVDQDFLVYPIVYLYRHHVELSLKRLIVVAANLAEEELDHQTSKNLEKHRLDQLWADLKRLLTPERSGVEIDQPESDGIGSYIKQLSTIDPEAHAFRYARDKKGKISLDQAPEYINIAAFAELMERLCTSLAGLDSYFDHLIEVRGEMAADAAGNADFYDD
jgi:hypothetical protein